MNTKQDEYKKRVEAMRSEHPAMFKNATLRDWFAGMALQGYASHPMADSRNGEADRYAAAAYRFADAMLAARKEAR